MHTTLQATTCAHLYEKRVRRVRNVHCYERDQRGSSDQPCPPDQHAYRAKAAHPARAKWPYAHSHAKFWIRRCAREEKIRALCVLEYLVSQKLSFYQVLQSFDQRFEVAPTLCHIVKFIKR